MGKTNVDKALETKEHWTIEQKSHHSNAISAARKKEWENMDDEKKEKKINDLDKGRKIFLEKTPYLSRIELRIQNIFNQAGISYHYNYFIGRRSYDFKIKNLIIEIQGDYWHMNPKVYKKDDINPSFQMTAEKVWEKDKKKKEYAEKYGYKVLCFWEKEIRAIKEDVELKSYILNKIEELIS